MAVHFAPMLDSMGSFRVARRLSVASIATLALGIAAVTAMFSIYSQTVLHPVTVAHPDSLVSVYSVNRKVSFVPPSLSWPRYEFIRDHGTAFSAVAAHSDDSAALSGTGDGPAEQLRVLRVSGAFFRAVEAVPVRGRVFTQEEDVPNGPAVCMLSWELWQTRFGGREMLGTNIMLDRKPTQVVGILGPALSPPWADRQIFVPRVFEDSAVTPQAVAQQATFLEIVARLKPGVTLSQAADQMHSLSRDYATRFAGSSDASSDLEVRTLVDTVAGSRRPVFLALLGAVAVVLLVACANTSALFLSQLASRERETAIMQALGASRSTVVLQFLRESLAVAVVAGVLGVLGAVAILRVADSTLAAQLPAGVRLTLDTRALLLAVGTVLFCSLMVGLVPALHVTRPVDRSPLAAYVRGASENAATRRFRAALVIIEVSLSVVLLVGTSLLIASLDRLRHTSPGFDASGLASGFVNLSAEQYRTPERQAAFFLDVVDRLKRSPQVSGAAVVFGLPFNDGNFASTYTVGGRPILPPADRARAGLRIITEDYFDVMRIRLTEGRAFQTTDRAGTQGVCIVNQSLARRQFGGASAIGQTIRRGRQADQVFEIVGVVADVKTNGLRLNTPDEIFFPFRQLPRSIAAIVARTTGDPAQLAPLFRQAAAEVDPYQPVSRFSPMEVRLAETLGPERVMSGVTAAFASLALFLAAMGLYAVLGHSVAARRIEIGVRIAIGARQTSVVRLIVGQGMRLVGFGILAGLVAAAAGARVLASQLYAVDPRDPVVYALVAAVFAVVGVAAALAPAIRAARVDPLIAMQGRDL